MKIKEIRAVEIELNPKPTTLPRTPSRSGTYQLNRPTSRYPTFDKKERDVSLEMEKARMYCDSGRWHLGVRYFASWRSGDPNHHRLLCPTPCWRKLHGD